MPKTQLTYAMNYGFITGPRHSRRLRELLGQAGYAETTDLAKADIIIAHSSGCWLLPVNISPKLMCFFAPALNPAISSSWYQANWLPVWTTIKQGAWANVTRATARYALYGTTQFRRNLRIIRGIKQAKLPACAHSQVVFIANHDDPWPQAPILRTYLRDRPWAFISLSGAHEAIWQHPDLTVAIINHYARLLA